MSGFPNALDTLIDRFAALPGIGRKSAQRLAFHVLSLPDDEAIAFADAITEAKRAIHRCPVCQNLTDEEQCSICSSPKRDQSTICVVAQPRDVLSFATPSTAVPVITIREAYSSAVMLMSTYSFSHFMGTFISYILRFWLRERFIIRN